LEPVIDKSASRLLLAARDRGIAEPIPVHLRDGPALLVRPNSTDLNVLYEVFVTKDYHFPFPPPATIIDAGAYIGLTALWFHQTYPDAHIVAIEPDPANFALLQRNTDRVQQITCVHSALWIDQSGVFLHDPGIGAWGMRVAPKATSIRVPSIDVGSLMQALKWQRLGLLKLDIEGAEEEVLVHSGNWLPSCDAIVAELHDHFHPGCSRAFFRATDDFECGAVNGENVARWRPGQRAKTETSAPTQRQSASTQLDSAW
jgi:FkbM family methyltransferase